jgi:gamma-glutamyltranspeptidase/glutathione hydrolase
MGLRSVGAWIVLICLAAPSGASGPPQCAVASAHPLATRAGIEALAQGGNAFDAAVAVSAALAVVQPWGSGLGGGGFWLLRRSDGREMMVDGRERAPRAATRDMYLDRFGNVVPSRSIDGPLAAAIPGAPAVLAHLSEHYGRLGLRVTLRPAIRYAEQGFLVGGAYARAVRMREAALRRWPAGTAIFFDHGRLPAPGFRLVQPDLAVTLRSLARHGRDGFYGGAVADRLVREVRHGGGRWSLRDLDEYRPVERKPIVSRHRNLAVTTAAPPGGGAVLIEALNVLSAYDLSRHEPVTRTHLVVEAMRRAYHDRDRFLGDPDFVAIPLNRLLSLDYAAGLRTTVRLDRALPSVHFAANAYPEPEGANTTHFSVIDREGNSVAATLSINYPFGSGFVAAGTGVVLNDEMDDFAARPGTPNVYGLVGGEPNAIAPGKRMLSSMTPTFLDDGERFAIVGTPGGSRITSMVLLATLDFAAGAGGHSMVSRRRYHHQYLPDRIEFEPGALSTAEVASLRARGHEIKALERPYGDMHAVIWDRRSNRVTAASDPRGEGSAANWP